MIGKMIVHYPITNELGKGGMGEVFPAKDQVLGCELAIKVLPDAPFNVVLSWTLLSKI